jgi:hypothetical protein
MSGYHWRDEWYFTRLTDGSVELRNENFVDDRRPEPSPFVRLVIPASEWASIVASVSKNGETGETHQAALTFHGT